MENTERSSKNFSKNITNQEKVLSANKKKKLPKQKLKKEDCPVNCPINCEEHVFELKKIDVTKYSKIKNERVSFCQRNRQAFRKPIIAREFLKLKEFALFTTKQQINLTKNQFKEYKEYFKKIQRQEEKLVSEENGDILMPMPSRPYCKVCEEKYVDYLDHIRSKKHKLKIKNNPEEKKLHALTQRYKKTRELEEQGDKFEEQCKTINEFFNRGMFNKIKQFLCAPTPPL